MSKKETRWESFESASSHWASKLLSPTGWKGFGTHSNVWVVRDLSLRGPGNRMARTIFLRISVLVLGSRFGVLLSWGDSHLSPTFLGGNRISRE